MKAVSLLLACSLGIALAQSVAAATVACTDPCLKAALASLYIRSPFLSPFALQIRVENAVITLEGTVSDKGKRDLAVEIARGIEGVSEVVDHLQVDPESAPEPPVAGPACRADDALLAERVRSQLYWNRNTHGLSLEISASNGVVTLQGEVATRSEAALARLIALNTCGVSEVHSKLRVTAGE
jgi:hypothetical protein